MTDAAKQIRELLKKERPSAIIELVKTNYYDEPLPPSILSELFLAYISSVDGWEDEKNGISQPILIESLCEINKWFRSTNGCQWARSDNSQLGKVYNIERIKKSNSVYSVQLKGFNNSNKRNRSIRKDIVETIQKQRCVILDVGVQIEVDHKSGRYNDERVANIDKQEFADFQPLHKSANDAKRHHCQVCLQNKERYNAQRLGYKEGWIYGNEGDTVCKGCYWYDPKEFNQVISKDFIKEEDK